MTTDDKIKDEKLQYDIIRKSAQISRLLSGKTDQYEYLTGEEILPSDQSRIMEQAKFTYFSLGKAFEKKTKNDWRVRHKTSWSFKSFKTRRKSGTRSNWRTFSKKDKK